MRSGLRLLLTVLWSIHHHQVRQHQAMSLPYCQTLLYQRNAFWMSRRVAKCVKCDDSVTEAKLNSLTAFAQPLPPAENHTQVKGDVADEFQPYKWLWKQCYNQIYSNLDRSVGMILTEFSRNLEDKSKIENSSRLTDKYISFTNSLISHQFPHIGDLCSTLQILLFSITKHSDNSNSIGLWLQMSCKLVVYYSLFTTWFCKFFILVTMIRRPPL